MAFLAIDPQLEPAPRTPIVAPPSQLEEVLAAVQRLAAVDSVHLIRRDDGSGTAELVADCRSGRSMPLGAKLLAAMEASGRFMLGTSEPQWIDHPLDRDGQTLLVRLSDQPSGTLFLLLGVGEMSDLTRIRVARLVPDLSMLVRHHLSLDLLLGAAEEARDAAREALDHGECGVIAVRGDHSIVFSNAAGAQHLAGRQGLHLRRGALRPVDHGKAIRFEAALDSVIDPAAGDGIRRPRASVMLLDGSRDDPRSTIIVIAPAGHPSADRDQARGAAAMVYILPPAQGSARGLDTLCRLHGLSRVESQLITHLMEGLTISEAAVRMRVKIETARTYLKQVFAKTGMHRQTDLVTLMTRYLRAIRGDFDFQPA